MKQTDYERFKSFFDLLKIKYIEEETVHEKYLRLIPGEDISDGCKMFYVNHAFDENENFIKSWDNHLVV